MKTTYLNLGPFLGPVTSLDPSFIGKKSASDCLNVRFEDGVVKPRYGYKTVVPMPNWTHCLGFAYASGYDNSYNTVEEFLAVGKAPDVIPVGIDPITKNTWGIGSVSLHDSNWNIVPFDSKAYFINPKSTPSIYAHDIGDETSFDGLVIPPTPSKRPTYTYDAPQDIDLAGLVPSNSAHVICTGRAINTNATLLLDTVSIRHNHSSTAASITIDLTKTTAGAWNMQDKDSVSLVISEQGYKFVALSIESIKITLINASGTEEKCRVYAKRDSNNLIQITAWFNLPKSRTEWTAVNKIKIEYAFAKAIYESGGTSSIVNFTFSKLGYKEIVPITSSGKELPTVKLAYTRYSSSTGFESQLSDPFEIEYGWLQLPCPPDITHGSGFSIKMWITDPSSTYSTAVYMLDRDGIWRRVATALPGATQTSSICLDYLELTEKPAFETYDFDTTAPASNAVPFKGWLVWLYERGKENVRHSRVGEPLKQANAKDLPDDLGAGADFSLSDDFSDHPVAGFQALDALVILGKYGVYAQWGDRPTNMSPFVKLTGSKGVAGPKACARWRSPEGGTAIVYADSLGENLYIVNPDMQNPTVQEFSVPIRGLMKSFLIDGQSASPSDIIVRADESTNSLWVICKKRAMVLRRPSLLDNARHWELYEYPAPIDRAVFTEKYGKLCALDNGDIYELERDAITGQPYTEDNMDKIENCYWTSKMHMTGWSYVKRYNVSKVNQSDEPEIVEIVNGEDKSRAVAQGSICRPNLITAEDRMFKIVVDNAPSGVKDVAVELARAGEKL